MQKNTRRAGFALILYGTPVILFAILPYTRNLYGAAALFILSIIIVFYSLFLFFWKKNKSGIDRISETISGLKKGASFLFRKHLRGEFSASPEEKVSLLLYGVKIVFTPLMIHFALDNARSLLQIISEKSLLHTAPLSAIVSYDFYAIFYCILLVDTLVFAFGYLVESPALKNTVRSVEPTALGWIAALLCYPPFNTVTNNIFGWYTADFSDFGKLGFNIFFGAVSLILFAFYVWATLALGWKASNLTNRGIVSRGPYKYLRHPAYVSKNLSWWIMGIPFIAKSGLIAVLSMAAWSFIYYIRAITEERHLLADPDYVEYTKKVKYRFIPGVF